MSRIETYYIMSSDWMKPIIAGIVIYFLCLFLKWNLYYFHFYLLFAAVVSFFVSYSRYLELNEKELTLFYGIPFLKKTLIVTWDQIVSISLHYIERRAGARGGKFGGLPFKYNQKTILINLNKRLDKTTIENIQGHNNYLLFGEGFEITKEGSGVILLDEPKVGFERLLKSFSKYVIIDDLNLKSQISKYERLFLYVWEIIIIILVSLFVLWLINNIS
jgi:hypothetical protein